MLNSCNHENSTNSNLQNSQSIIYGANPYEYVGIDHNIVINYFLDDVENDDPTFADPFTNTVTFQNQVAAYLLEALTKTEVDDDITLSEIVTEMENLPLFEVDSAADYFNTMWYDRLSNYIDNEILPNVSYNDSIWIDNIRDLYYDFCYDNFNDPTDTTNQKSPDWFISQIAVLENQMLQVDWDANDKDALIMLAVLKHTTNLWYDEFDLVIKTKSNEIPLGLSKEEIKDITFATALIGYDAFFLWYGTSTAATVWTILDHFGIIDEWLDQFDW